MTRILTRRTALVGLGASMLAGCDRLAASPSFQRVLATAEGWNLHAQRLLLRTGTLAPEFTQADVSKVFKANGSTQPASEAYARLAEGGFADWRLRIDGLVRQPLSLSLVELRRLPARTQITRHDCVEGWSCIGGWTGTPLALLLGAAGVLPTARYVVFHCADDLEESADGSGLYYESVDLVDAYHPQTILAYEMNGQTLPVAHGAPLRLRLERQLGYKMAKYVMRIELVESYAHLGGGLGGYWEDRGYEWYAGI